MVQFPRESGGIVICDLGVVRDLYCCVDVFEVFARDSTCVHLGL